MATPLDEGGAHYGSSGQGKDKDNTVTSSGMDNYSSMSMYGSVGNGTTTAQITWTPSTSMGDMTTTTQTTCTSATTWSAMNTYSTPSYGSGSYGGSGYQSCMQSEIFARFSMHLHLTHSPSVRCVLWYSYYGILHYYVVPSSRNINYSEWFWRYDTHRYCCSYTRHFALCSLCHQCICW